MSASLGVSPLDQLRMLGAGGLTDALNDVGLDEGSYHRILERSDEFRLAMRQAAAGALKRLSAPQSVVRDLAPQTSRYPAGYRLQRLDAQVRRLLAVFPSLVFGNDEQLQKILDSAIPLPEGVEGWFAIPRWEALARTYHDAAALVIDALHRVRFGKFHNWRKDISSPYLQQTNRNRTLTQGVQQGQRGDILFVPAQFGLRHAGRSVRKAYKAFTEEEFGLGVVEVGCMLLTHPERLEAASDLGIDCSGDKYFSADKVYNTVPFLRVQHEELWLSVRKSSCGVPVIGAASGFVPKRLG